MLDVKRLRILREVVNQGSFSGAADALYLSQSAVSQQIATLEREVGMKLLERTRERNQADGRGPRARLRTPTPRSAASTRRSASSRRSPGSRAAKSGSRASPAPARPCSRSASRDFTRRHPKVKLPWPMREPEVSVPRLRAGELDVAITFDYPTLPEPDERDIEHTLLLTESMHVALPIDHPLASRARVKMSDLADEDWLSGGCPSSCGADRLPGVPRRRLRAADRLRVRRLPRAPRLYRRRPRRHASARPGPPHAPQGRRRPPDRARRRRCAVSGPRRESTRSAATDAMLKCLVAAGEHFAAATTAKLEAVA